MGVVEKAIGVPFDNGPIGPNGQYRDYAVLPQSERDRGFIRPIRCKYTHVGLAGPKYTLRDLIPEELERYKQFGYIKFEKYPAGIVGMYWTEARLAQVGKGCMSDTTMNQAIAETYARNPKYYGSTFCCFCGKHLSVEEFIWAGTKERVGE